ncbi:hypothetical protein NM688_g3301 [Phlebia brevispora]|uniref:Uncharacterized protein n=1 Tax=Phlebia brevispora TaxID=194682 RepID=A0ACC1T6A0_9APHY|nr:hypothetical protein NM688_g3301 [Phlebia brevispora]
MGPADIRDFPTMDPRVQHSQRAPTFNIHLPKLKAAATQIRVVERAGTFRTSTLVAWQLTQAPSRRIGSHSRVNLRYSNGAVIGIVRNICGVLGISKHWITFLLESKKVEHTLVHTLAVPIMYADVPLKWAIFHFLFICRSHVDEFADIRLPLPPLQLHNNVPNNEETPDTHRSAGVGELQPRPSDTEDDRREVHNIVCKD